MPIEAVKITTGHLHFLFMTPLIVLKIHQKRKEKALDRDEEVHCTELVRMLLEHKDRTKHKGPHFSTAVIMYVHEASHRMQQGKQVLKFSGSDPKLA